MVSWSRGAILHIVPIPDLVFWIWSSNQKRCSQSFPDNWCTDDCIADCISVSLSNEPTSSIFLDAIKVLGNGSRLSDFYWISKRASIEQFLEKVPPLLVMALIAGVMYLPMSMASASTIAIVALSSILIACLKKQTAAFKIFTNPKVVYIGLISYSLYLWHWGVLSISRWTIGIHWWSIPFQVALMFGLAVASYRWIETPFRRLKIQQRKTVFGFLICSTILTTSGIILLLQCSKIFYLGNTLRPLGKEIVQNNKLLWGDTTSAS